MQPDSLIDSRTTFRLVMLMMKLMFLDRIDAGKQLAQALMTYKGRPTVVHALPRGGVVLGAEIARSLAAMPHIFSGHTSRNVPIDLNASRASLVTTTVRARPANPEQSFRGHFRKQMAVVGTMLC